MSGFPQRRVSKTDSAGTRAQITDGTCPASPVLKDARAVYTPGISERAGTTSKFYHGDALGSTRGITNSSQTVTDAVLCDAFGMTVSRTGTTATPFGFVGAQGYQSDSDSGLQLLGHRYYDPSIGRFLSSDPAKAGTNWYAYCENNPITRVDPQGEFVILILAIIALVIIAQPHAGEPPNDPWHHVYPTVGDAGRGALRSIEPVSIGTGYEYGGAIRPVSGGFTPDIPTRGDRNGFDNFEWPIPRPAGHYHTHPPGGPDSSDDGDQNRADVLRVPEFAGDPTGDIWKNVPRSGRSNDPYPANPHNPRYNDGAVRIPHGWN
jgi:RHS repeat-associated protein